MASTAVSQVFESALLLERIFRQGLSPAEVTRARQVNTFIKTVIDNSKPLRRIMFLEPETTPERLIRDNGSNTEFTVMKVHPAILAPSSSSNGSDYRFAIKEKLANTNWNPGMWQSMLICQPPAEEITLHFTRQASSGADWEPPQSGLNIRVKGNTLGALVTTIKDLLSDSEDTMTRVWDWDLRVSVKGCLEEGNPAVPPARLHTQAITEAAEIKRRAVAAAAEAKRKADTAKSEATEIVPLTAAARVFGVTELLEQVLLGLSTIEITRSRQVSRTFKDTIDESVPLRRAMFLEPELVGETLAYANDEREWDWPDDPNKPAKQFAVVKFHPLTRGEVGKVGNHYETFLPHLDFTTDGCMPGTMWEKMLICQPPCPELRLAYCTQRSRYMGSQVVYTERESCLVTGNTLHDLSVAVAELESKQDQEEETIEYGFSSFRRRKTFGYGFELKAMGGPLAFEKDGSWVVDRAREKVAYKSTRVEVDDEESDTASSDEEYI